MVWELVFLLVILKIPVVYLCWVVWWALRSKPEPPEPLEGALATSPLAPAPRPAWSLLRGPSRRRPRRPGPHGAPRRAPARAPVFASWRAAGWRPER
ncbi:MAG TPA: hypothetical protein VFA44_09445 [Gaiellaceae bacterium]|nr:hypothetical protein [Gaiellaceae bacterium]